MLIVIKEFDFLKKHNKILACLLAMFFVFVLPFSVLADGRTGIEPISATERLVYFSHEDMVKKVRRQEWIVFVTDTLKIDSPSLVFYILSYQTRAMELSSGELPICFLIASLFSLGFGMWSWAFRNELKHMKELDRGNGIVMYQVWVKDVGVEFSTYRWVTIWNDKRTCPQ